MPKVVSCMAFSKLIISSSSILVTQLSSALHKIPQNNCYNQNTLLNQGTVCDSCVFQLSALLLVNKANLKIKAVEK